MRHRVAWLIAAATVAPAPAAAQGIIVSEPVYWAHCAARFIVKAERTADPALVAALQRSAELARTRSRNVPPPPAHTPEELDRFALEMGRLLRERLAGHPSMPAELDRSVAQCERDLETPAR